MLIKSRNGQLGDTITWIVATVVIVAILLFFIFGASLLANTKKIGVFKESLTSKPVFGGEDIFLKKSLYTYYVVNSGDSKRVIEERLKEIEKQGGFELPLDETKKEILKNLNKK